MTQPTSRFADVEPCGEIDDARREFWVRSPWKYPDDKNLSGYEPNVLLWNRGDMNFSSLTYVSGAGTRGDGRAVLVLDADGDFAPDLLVRQASLGPLRLFLNRFPAKRHLIVELDGTKSNARGIGARIEAHVGERVITRQLWPINNFHCQQLAQVRFGLGDAQRIDKLVIHWPSGLRQELLDVETNQFLRVREGSGEPEVVR